MAYAAFFGSICYAIGFVGNIFVYHGIELFSTLARNCNSAGDDGGGMYNDGVSNPNVTNCIFWSNSATGSGNEVYNGSDPNTDPNFAYCDIEGSGGSSSWDPNFGSNDGGNIDLKVTGIIAEIPEYSHFHLDMLQL